jgi:PAS domain S-box-containing protein
MEGDNESHVYLSGPIFISGVVVGMITIATDLEDLAHIVNDYSGMGKTGETFLAKKDINGNALFIAPPRFDPEDSFSRVIPQDQLEVPITQALLSQEIKMKDAIDYRGEKVLAVTKYIENTGWGLVSKIDKSEVYASFYEANVIQLGLIIVLVGVMVSISLAISDRILKPIVKLKDKVRDVEKGNYDTELPSMENNEISPLIEALFSLQKSLKKQEKETKTFEEKLKKQLKAKNDLQNAIDQSSIVVVLNKDGTIIYVNKEFEEITKFSADELVGKSHKLIRSGFHTPEFYDGIWNTISSGNVWKGNIKNKSKDGAEFWTRTVITPFLGEDGIPEQYVIVKTDITELIAQKDLIQRQFKELKNIDVRKEEFASMVSHELKTPITPIKFNTEMLLEPGVLGPLTKDQEDAIKEIEINSQRLENLISDILYAQRLDMNRMVFNKKKFSSRDLLGKISKNLSSLMEEKSIEFEVKDEYLGTINSDEGRIQQILENLVKNSIDFVDDKGGKISMGVKNHDNYAIFYVKDNGIGIPKEKQKNLFKKFYQVDTSHTRKHGGTGLGLVISKGFAEGLGGEIWCESEVGKGSGFYFSIPKNQEIEVKTNG